MKPDLWRGIARAIAAGFACLVLPASAHAEIVMQTLTCQGGTSLGAPPGGYFSFTVTDLQPGTYFFVAVTDTGLIFNSSPVGPLGANLYTGPYYGPMTLLILPTSAVTRDANGLVTAYDGTSIVFSTTIVVPPCAAERLSFLLAQVAVINANAGIENSLDAKLASILDTLAAAKSNDIATAIAKLDAFINEVQAQSGKQIDAVAAAMLIQLAEDVKARLLAS
jgi:hypothetical protein